MVDCLISGKGKRFSQTSSGADSACSSVCIGILFPGLKWLGCEADHSPQYSSEVKNERSSTPSPICLCVVSRVEVGVPLLPPWAFVACFSMNFTFKFLWSVEKLYHCFYMSHVCN
jgi:hypothetical protein